MMRWRAVPSPFPRLPRVLLSGFGFQPKCRRTLVGSAPLNHNWRHGQPSALIPSTRGGKIAMKPEPMPCIGYGHIRFGPTDDQLIKAIQNTAHSSARICFERKTATICLESGTASIWLAEQRGRGCVAEFLERYPTVRSESTVVSTALLDYLEDAEKFGIDVNYRPKRRNHS